jgi:uncharacterized membrane protein YphA (DoxX/SURF4 family)
VWVYAYVLAVVRILTGAMWVIHGIPKFTQSDAFMPPNGMIGGFVTTALGKTSGFYHDFLLNVVQPHLPIFAELVRLGEILAGCALIFGLLTRVAALAGVLMALNYMAARGDMHTLNAWGSIDASFLLLSLISLALPTGRVLGLDGLLFRRRTPAPAAPTVRAEFVPEPPLEGPTAPPNP